MIDWNSDIRIWKAKQLTSRNQTLKGIFTLRDRPWKTSAVRDEGSCPMRSFFGQGGGGGDFSDADVRTFWCKKLPIFRNLWYARTEKGSQFVAILCIYGMPARKRVVSLSRFCVGILYWRPLTRIAWMEF